MKRSWPLAVVFSLTFGIGGAAVAAAGWEAGTSIGFDTNVDRSIEGGRSDGFLTAYGGFAHGPSGERRWGFTFSATVEGSAYARTSELDSVAATAASGIVYVPRALWTATITPFVQAKEVRDSDQSAVAAGGKVAVEERIRRNLYLGEYYVYTDSRAHSDTFSFSEHTLGAYLGVAASASLRAELGYAFTHGDSFRSVGTGPVPAAGFGMHRMFSSAFGTDVVREKVDRHAVSVTVSKNWSTSLFSRAGYTLTDTEGSLGSSVSHSGFAGIGYRF